MRVEVERFPARVVRLGPKVVMYVEEAVADCGCRARIGVDIAPGVRLEPVVVFRGCPDHEEEIRSAQEAYRESLANPSDRSAVSVARDVLRGVLSS